MSAMKVEKTLKVKRLNLLDSNGQLVQNINLATLVSRAHKKLNSEEREFRTGLLDHIQSCDYREHEGDILIHIVVYEIGGKASIVSRAKESQPKRPLIEEEPLREGEYLNKECFIYFFGNFVLFLTNKVSNLTATQFVTDLLLKSNEIDKNCKITIADISNVDAVWSCPDIVPLL